jgi:hypothetical protein
MVWKACNPSTQGDCEFQISLGYIIRPCLTTKYRKKKFKRERVGLAE